MTIYRPYCEKHGRHFELEKSWRGAEVLRCPDCVSEAKAKVALERDRYQQSHGGRGFVRKARGEART